MIKNGEGGKQNENLAMLTGKFDITFLEMPDESNMTEREMKRDWIREGESLEGTLP